jgi:hypothetical protein
MGKWRCSPPPPVPPVEMAGSCILHASCRFSPGKCSRLALHWTLGGPQSLSSCLGGVSCLRRDSNPGTHWTGSWVGPKPVWRRHISLAPTEVLNLVPLKRKEAVWTPESALTLWRSEKCLAPARIRTPDRPSRSRHLSLIIIIIIHVYCTTMHFCCSAFLDRVWAIMTGVLNTFSVNRLLLCYSFEARSQRLTSIKTSCDKSAPLFFFFFIIGSGVSRIFFLSWGQRAERTEIWGR